MRKLLLILSFIFSFYTYSQDTTFYNNGFDQEWYDKLDSKLEYIVYKNSETGLYSIRIYRGDATEHCITIKNYFGDPIYIEIIERDCELDLSFLNCGYYLIEIRNREKSVTQILHVN